LGIEGLYGSLHGSSGRPRGAQTEQRINGQLGFEAGQARADATSGIPRSLQCISGLACEYAGVGHERHADLQAGAAQLGCSVQPIAPVPARPGGHPGPSSVRRQRPRQPRHGLAGTSHQRAGRQG
jgi:hypothetical protein